MLGSTGAYEIPNLESSCKEDRESNSDDGWPGTGFCPPPPRPPPAAPDRTILNQSIDPTDADTWSRGA